MVPNIHLIDIQERLFKMDSPWTSYLSQERDDTDIPKKSQVGSHGCYWIKAVRWKEKQKYYIEALKKVEQGRVIQIKKIVC